MSTVPNPAQPRTYPLPAPTDDRRFTLGLVFDVARVLADHGFPEIASGGDLVGLQQALFNFTYERPAGSPPAAAVHEQVAEVLDGVGPIPAGVDQETAAAVRRIARHFAEHGCLTFTPPRPPTVCTCEIEEPVTTDLPTTDEPMTTGCRFDARAFCTVHNGVHTERQRCICGADQQDGDAL